MNDSFDMHIPMQSEDRSGLSNELFFQLMKQFFLRWKRNHAL